MLLQQRMRCWYGGLMNSPHRGRLLFIWICWAGNSIESTGDTKAQEIVVIVVAIVAVLIILRAEISPRNIVEVVKKGLSHAEFQSQVPLWIKHILDASAKRDSHLHRAVGLCTVNITREAKKGDASKQVGSKSHKALSVPPVQEVIFHHRRTLEENVLKRGIALHGKRVRGDFAGTYKSGSDRGAEAYYAAEICPIKNGRRGLGKLEVVELYEITRVIERAKSEANLRTLGYGRACQKERENESCYDRARRPKHYLNLARFIDLPRMYVSLKVVTI